MRIHRQLQSLADISLLDFPEDNCQTMEEFLEFNKKICDSAATVLQAKNNTLQEAINDLLDILQDNRLIRGDDDDESADGSVDGEDLPIRPTTGCKSQQNRASSNCSKMSTKLHLLVKRRSTLASLGSNRPPSYQRQRFLLRRRLRDASHELLRHYTHLYTENLAKMVRDQLEALFRAILAQSNPKGPYKGLIQVSAELVSDQIKIIPSLEEIQTSLNNLVTMVLSIFKLLPQWTRSARQKRMINSSTSIQVKNFYSTVADNLEVVRVVSLLSTVTEKTLVQQIDVALQRLKSFSTLWTVDCDQHLKSFLEDNPNLVEFEDQIILLHMQKEDIESEAKVINVGGIVIFTDNAKATIMNENDKWISSTVKVLKDKYRRECNSLLMIIGDLSRRMSRPIRDLDDIRYVMKALEEVQQTEIDLEIRLEQVEGCYSMVGQFGLGVLKEESERVDGLRYSWSKLLAQSNDVQEFLQEIHPHFFNQLKTDITNFSTDCQEFYLTYATNGPVNPDLPPKEAYDRLVNCQNRLETLWRRFQAITSGEELFGMQASEYQGKRTPSKQYNLKLPITICLELSRIRKEINLLQKLYKLYGEVTTSVQGYYSMPWADIDVEVINNELMEYQNRCRKLPKGLKEWPAFFEAKKMIDDFNELCPLLELMANKAMKTRHWRKISEVCAYPLQVNDDNCTLNSVLEAPLLKHKEDIEDICISAVKEKDIEAKLKSVTNEWEYLQLSFSVFKNRGELLLRGDSTAEIVTKMEDSLVVLGSLLNNRYNAPFRKKIQTWVSNLSSTSEVLEKWLLVQNMWVYLEAVFVGGDIANQLPKEASRFYSIDKSWQKVMQRAHEMTNVVQCCIGDDVLKQLLPHLEEQLELCQRSLSGYLEKKRFIFPRFFFVSDPALLEILGQSSDSHTIQSHLLSIFDNTKSVVFHESDYDRILGVVSSEGETIKFKKPVRAIGSVEIWLTQLLITSQDSIHDIIHKANQAIQEPNFKLLEFLAVYPAQIGILGLQIIWTREAEMAIAESRHDRKIMFEANNRFLDMLNILIEQTTLDLNHFERVKYETLITIHVHQRDIFDQMCQVGIRSLSDFEWQKQCRFYFREDIDKMCISITDVTFTYQNEFLGCSERLVITPLTDRCYITLAQALRMSMGACSTGPAGTGKTETVKDMGKTLGKYIVLFNCSDQMDFKGLGRIFKGLAQSGSWGCFDEFNRIDLPVLSVAAQQIACLLLCKKEHRHEFIFTDGDSVQMNPEFGIFLTMNPGYAGRKELPENLKVQFRTVAMMVPDRQIIIRVKLASCGFLENITLARKFYALYKLCEEQLSKQVHYDFGLRNILSVLRTLGSAKKANPDDSETTIVMRVLRDMNLSKLVDEDEPLFLSLINDLFPNNQLDKVGYPQLEEAIRNQLTLAGLVDHEPWVLKLIQLYETQQVRHGIMTLGPSGSGKTTCIHILMKALTECGQPHRELRMNPKALTPAQMFGRLDVATNDWTDGVFAALWRKTLKSEKDEHIWLVLDGPVDSHWIENLNSVLDDNRTLTLVNGDRIPMSPNCKIIFETHNIDNASPATVSRNGMVYMSSSILTWEPIFKAWAYQQQNKTLTPEKEHILHELFRHFFEDIYNWSIQNVQLQMEVLQCNVVNQMLTLLAGLIADNSNKEQVEKQTSFDENGTAPTPTQQDTQQLETYLNRLFTFVILWSIGALLEVEDRITFEMYLRTITQPFALELPNLSADDTVYNYMVNQQGEWYHWDKIISDKKLDQLATSLTGSSDPSAVLVPHIDSVRTDFLVDTVAKQGKAVLLLGAQGAAKTVLIKSYMKKYNSEVQLGKQVNFSSATTPYQFQKIMEGLMDKRTGTVFGPPNSRKMTLFMDDLSLPMYNEWGDQPVNEIVRQTMEMKGFYSLEKPGEFISLVDLQFVAAMMQPGGGCNDIPSRLKRHFTIFNCTLPSNKCLDKIFGVIGGLHYCSKRGFTPEVQELVQKLVPITRILWQQTKEFLLPTPANFHYIFNLRDLSRIWGGMVGTMSSVVCEANILMSLWKHECCRVISDRFTSPKDVEWFENKILQVVEQNLSEDYVPMVKGENFFVDFLRDAPEPTGEEGEELDIEQPKVYEPIESFDSLSDRLKMFLTQYNEMVRGSGMDLVFFQDAMIHLVKVSRIIRSPGGNAMLVGVGGSGKQSLSKLASFIAGYKTFQITLTRSYGLANLLDDLKVLFRTTGCQGKGTTFIFTEQDIKEEAFLEYLNSLLSAGTVYNLFNKEDQSEIVAELTPIMKREFPRRPPTPENVLEYFASRIYQNLHVVLCFSPVGEKFRNRCLRFPGLVSGCTIDWYQPWPRDALVAVSRHFLSDFDVMCQVEVKEQLMLAMAAIQENVAMRCTHYFQRFRRSFHVTPKSYLTFLGSYKQLYNGKKTEIDALKARMDHGLAKLEEASGSVSELKMELDAMEVELEEAAERAGKVLMEVTERAREAEEIRNRVQKSTQVAQVIVNEISVEKAIAEEKLELARPALAEAEAALNTIKPAHIATVRKLGRPPHLIMRVMDCVLLLFQRRVQPVKADPNLPCAKPSWNESLKMMSHTNFLQMLQTFPKDTINDETVELLEPFLNMEDYNMETARRVCGDVAGLLSWTKAMVFFYAVNKEVLPLKANLAVQEARLRVATHELHCLQEDLADKEKELMDVKQQYENAVASKQRLSDQASLCRQKMNAAAMLISGLANEKTRWTEQSKELKEKLGRLVGDILLSTSFLCYAGPFNQEFRTLLLNSWTGEIETRDISFSQNYNLVEMFTDASVIAEWNLQGLPSDELSVQNGVIVSKAICYPLLIDPQGQGKAWIRNREVGNEIQITSLNHKYFRNHLEDSLSLGRPLLIEDVGEDLDPVLDNLLEKNFIKSGTTLKVMLADKECDVMKGFALYITTKLPNPVYAPEISAKTTLVDFAVTTQGLEEQLLGRVIMSEKNDLEHERVHLMADVMENKRKIKQLEDSLLSSLTSTRGSLVDDSELLTVLQRTKAAAAEVNEKLTVGAETERKINAAREEFRSVAIRGSILYFLIVEMSQVDAMYQTSLKQFLALFDFALAKYEN
ncbi:Dynein heavy chain 5, axonemal [Chamberlinius hualienensis]